MNINSKNQKLAIIINRLFIEEPLMFIALLSHDLVENNDIKSLRCGNMLIEYNANFVDNTNIDAVTDSLKVELIRILLKHPYQRQKKQIDLAYLASQLSIGQFFSPTIPLPKCKDFWPENYYRYQSMEFYYQKLIELFATSPTCGTSNSKQSSSDDNKGQSENKQNSSGNNDRPFLNPSINFNRREAIKNSELWKENDFFAEIINQKIESTLTNSDNYGSIKGYLLEQIIASLKPKLNYRNILRQFKATIISSKRILTRMRPNRRYGFAYLGSRYAFTTSMLVAVDTSGSISNEELALAYSIINRFFKYGIETIDCIAFDTKIADEKFSLKKAKKKIVVKGRGGTYFQPVFDYFKDQPSYDAMIIITDGYAPPPTSSINPNKVLWLFNSKENYDRCYESLKHLGKGCWVEKS